MRKLTAHETDDAMLKNLRILWEFSRPHTIIGTTLSVLGLYAIILAELPFSVNHLTMLAWTLIGCWAGNIYIVGLNQLEDIRIDEINKPYLPLPANRLSVRNGFRIITISAVTAVIAAVIGGLYLLVVIIVSLLIGTAYSLPPLRLKRFPVWASLSIFAVRGLVVNLGLFLHYTIKIAGIPYLSPEVWALTLFMLAFSLAIAWYKDMPDAEGDRRFGIRTFTVYLGPRTVLNTGLVILGLAYFGISLAALWQWIQVNVPFTIISHLLIFSILYIRRRQVDLQKKESIAGFYQFIWKLFYLEYLIFPAAVLL